MSARHKVKQAQDEEALPTLHRTIRLPAGLWRAVKARGSQEDKVVRLVVAEALAAQLAPLVGKLRKLGLRGEVKADNLVRVPLDDNAIGLLNLGRRQTGLPAVQMLLLCLAKHTAGRRSRRMAIAVSRASRKHD